MKGKKYTYIIVPVENINLINFSQVFEERESLRFNNANTLFIVKFNGEAPIDLISYDKYTIKSLKLIINNPEKGWVKNNNI